MEQQMNIGVEISLYPLRNEFIPPIRDFIERLNADGRFKVLTNDMSTQVFGRYEDVMDALTREIRPTFERDGKAIFVMKVLGPLGQ
jgi:hypothetical protein